MGRGFVQYQLPDSGREEWVLPSAFIHYRLADGTKLEILQQPAWCPACGRFVIAEEIPSVQALQQEISRYRSADPDTLQQWAFASNGAPVAERVAELLRYVEWRQGRQSEGDRAYERVIQGCGQLMEVHQNVYRIAEPGDEADGGGM